MQINMFVDAAHASDLVTRRSVTGIVIFINKMMEGLRYKLRMMGIPIEGPTNTFCDNLSVVKNATDPSSMLKKKHNSIAYHKVRESVAADVQRIAHEPGHSNLADVLTKPLPAPTFHKHVHCILMQ